MSIPEIVHKEDLTVLMAQNDAARSDPALYGKLIRLEQLPERIEWTAEMPTLMRKPETVGILQFQTAGIRRLKTTLDISEKIFSFIGDNVAELLFQPFSNGGYFIIAGGAVCDTLIGTRINDVDIFAINVDPLEAEKRMQDIADYILKGGNRYCGIVTYRTPNCITLLYNDVGESKRTELQLITRCYTSCAEVLYGFDIAPAAALLRRESDVMCVEMTPLAAFAYRTNSFPLDLERRRASFETRINKYHHIKNFNVIFPELAPTALDCNEFFIYRLSFNEVRITGTGLQFNAIMGVTSGNPPEFRKFRNHGSPCVEVGPDEINDNEHQSTVYGSLPYHHIEDLVMFNVAKITRGSNYLVSARNPSGKCPLAWEVFVAQDIPREQYWEYAPVDIVQELFSLSRPVTLLIAIIARKIIRIIGSNLCCIKESTRYFNDKDIVGRIAHIKHEFVFSGCDHATDSENIRRQIVDIACEIGDTVAQRARAIKQSFVWKKSTDQTTLHVAAPLFEMSYVTPQDYYGAHYLPAEGALVKSAAKL
jgi:hypothetical protein